MMGQTSGDDFPLVAIMACHSAEPKLPLQTDSLLEERALWMPQVVAKHSPVRLSVLYRFHS